MTNTTGTQFTEADFRAGLIKARLTRHGFSTANTVAARQAAAAELAARVRLDAALRQARRPVGIRAGRIGA